jgi:SAM-dependent methyltransferase
MARKKNKQQAAPPPESDPSTEPPASRNESSDEAWPVSPAAMTLCLFSLSFATVLFTLAIFRLLSFFIMPSLFFDLLFIGFPIGAFIGAAWFRVDQRSFLRSLWLLQGITVFTIVAVVFAKESPYFDYLRAHLFNVEVAGLLYQMGTFTTLFIPFFAAYGLSEYIGYQVGRRLLAGRMRLVYALYLFGAAAAYIVFKFGVSTTGVARMLLLALACVAGAALLLSPGGSKRLFAGAQALALLVLLALPTSVLDLESTFLRHYKGQGMQSTWEYEHDRGCELAFQEWGRYSLCEIMKDPRGEYHGFYNDFFQWQYWPPAGFVERSLGMVPLLDISKESKIAIIGSGGGRQVRFAKLVGIKEVVAIELEPAVFQAVREELLDEFAQVYEKDGVTPVCSEARGYMERSEESFDLIYLPSVGGYPQMMLEPGNLIRTNEAYVTLTKRLKPDGMIALWYPRGLDVYGVLTQQYVRNLRALGLSTHAYENNGEWLILAFRNPERKAPLAHELYNIFTDATIENVPLGPIPPAQLNFYLPKVYPVEDDPLFTPISDDKPFLAGNVRHILAMHQVYQLFGIGGGLLAAVGIVLVLVLRRRGDPDIRQRSYWSVVGVTFLIGANFLVMEHYLVLALFKRTFIYYDSLMLGAISFLVLSGLGSTLATPKLRGIFASAASIAIVILMAAGDTLPPVAVVLLIAPIALSTGTFFPVIFELAAANPLAVFALDAIGAGFGTLLATFVPIAFGFPVFFAIAGPLFLLTVFANWRFHRGLTSS